MSEPKLPAKPVRSRRGFVPAGLASAVLGHLPLAIAVIDANLRLRYCNPQACELFGVPASLVPERPPMAEMLDGVNGLAPPQRDRIIAFCEAQIAAPDEAHPETCLRLSLQRDRRITLQIRTLGSAGWLLLFGEGLVAGARYAPSSPSGDPGPAWTDALTGLSNRRHFNERLRQAAATVTTADPVAAMLMPALLIIDLDRFKLINDTLGHPIGDALLCLVAQRLQREVREEDLLGRLGGDEFVVLISDSTGAERLADRIVDILARPYLIEGQIVNIGASIGIANFPTSGTSADSAMAHADLALYEAKRAGRGTWRMFEPEMEAVARNRRELENDLRGALERGELSVVYQPQLNIPTQTIGGFEALLRWHHPVRGEIPPDHFIPVAEEIGCIAAFGEFVLKTACQEAAGWPAPIGIAVNVSPRQIDLGDRLFEAVQTALAESGLAPARLELELTETAMLVDEPKLRAVLHRLRDLGVRIAMDDFGTGHSSLSQLQIFPFDRIKIDRRFISGLGLKDDAAAVLRAIATLSSGLRITTTAEGVETAVQAALVVKDGCTDIQGFLISRPVPASGIKALLQQYGPEGSHPDRPTALVAE